MKSEIQRQLTPFEREAYGTIVGDVTAYDRINRLQYLTIQELKWVIAQPDMQKSVVAAAHRTLRKRCPKPAPLFAILNW